MNTFHSENLNAMFTTEYSDVKAKLTLLVTLWLSHQNFLGLLEQPVRQIRAEPMEKLSQLFLTIYINIFVIWENAPYYNSQ
jgi:hypothetical protein